MRHCHKMKTGLEEVNSMLALSVVPRYRHQSLADLQNLVLEPLMRDRIAIASAVEKERKDGEGASPQAMEQAPGALAGIAFWATVSDEVDAKIREQIKGGAFPIRLKPDEWTSGGHTWLLDVIAPSTRMASAVLANFKQVVQGKDEKAGEVRIHPIVARQVDPELLKKMGATVDGAKEG
jgi:cytolysin-activating lysine-acyltransferase